MSIFSRREPGDIGQVSAVASPESGQDVLTTPGVLPPPAAPVYSTRPPELPRFDEAASTVTEAMRMAAEAQRKAQGVVRGRIEISAQRTRPAPGTSLQRQPQRALATRRPERRDGATPIDTERLAQTGLLNLAWSWQQAGAPIRAIHAYMQLLDRYPGTPAAAAAVADLVEISDILADQGQFHTALAIYDQLEELLAC